MTALATYLAATVGHANEWAANRMGGYDLELGGHRMVRITHPRDTSSVRLYLFQGQMVAYSVVFAPNTPVGVMGRTLHGIIQEDG